MQAGIAHAPRIRDTPPVTALIGQGRFARAIRASIAGGQLTPSPAGAPAGTFLDDRRTSASGTGLPGRRAPAGTGQPRR
jgi:hypothetical protein